MKILAALVGIGLVLLAGPALAQTLTLDFGGLGATGAGPAAGASVATRTAQLLILITVLGLVPGLAVTVTCFPFIVTVLSILRQAIGLQQAPPNLLMVSLALFLTWFVMEPVFQQSWAQGVEPLNQGRIELAEAIPAMAEPFRGFMAARVNPDTFATLAALRPGATAPVAKAPYSILVPAFMLSEISRAFQIGFLIFLPFLIIDLVVSAVLMAMGMMMVPPAIVSLPFKLAFFVAADGWALLSSALVRGYLG